MALSFLLAFALAGTPNAAQIEPSDLPLVVTTASYMPEQRSATFTIRNDGSVAIVAWTVHMVWRFPDGTETRMGLGVDSYEQAAGLADAPPGNVLLRPGESVHRKCLAPSRPGGEVPRGVTLTAQAVTLEGNRALGDPVAVNAIVAGRVEHAKAWADALARLEETKANTPDTHDRLRLASDRLEATAGENSQLGSVSNRLLYQIRVAKRGGEGPETTFDALVQQAQRHVEAAQRFSAVAADESRSAR